MIAIKNKMFQMKIQVFDQYIKTINHFFRQKSKIKKLTNQIRKINKMNKQKER